MDFVAICATHKGHVNKSPKDHKKWAAINASADWVDRELSPQQLAEWIQEGFAWTACQLGGRSHSEENVIASNLIALDIDGDLTLEAFWAIPAVQRHCLFTATSCSHTPDEHRFRAVFAVERHEEVDLHGAIYDLWLERLGIQLKDNGGRKPERLWYGNDKTELRFGDGEPIPWDLVEQARDNLKAARAALPRAISSANHDDLALDLKRAVFALDKLLRPSVDGDFSGGYWPDLLLAAAATGDEAVQQAFLQWHNRGHHSKTQTQVRRRLQKSRSRMSPGEGAGKILKAAKEQHGAQWWRLLPPDLQYGSGGGGTPPPRVLGRSRSLSDIAPLGESRAPDVVPSTAELEKLATSARYVPLGVSHVVQGQPSQSNPSISTAARIRQLIELIYWLKVDNIHRGPGGNALLSESEAEDQIDEYTSELLTYPVFNRKQEKIEQKLMQVFREQHGLRRFSRRNLKPEHLFSGDDHDPDPLIGDLMALGCSYFLFARQGVGKTMLALLLCRAALGTPGHSRFLDFTPVPAEVWKNQRVLYVASDGNLPAKSDLRRYARAMGQENAEWIDQMGFINANRDNGATRWRIDLYELHLLAKWLDDAAAAGTPYRMVVIDSLKAVTPDGLRVGAQEIVDYVDLVDGICSPRNVTVLYIHHQAKEGETAQGASGLLEMAHGVFRLKLEGSQRFFCIEKTRLDSRGNREIPYQITATGDLKIATYAAPEEADDQGRDLILRVLQKHYERHLQDVAHLQKTDPRRHYPGISKSEALRLVRATGVTPSSWKSTRTFAGLLGAMVQEGSLKRLKNSQVAIAGAETFIKVTVEQLQLEQEQHCDDETTDLPGW